VHQVRRLHVALRPYSYSQFEHVESIKHWLLGIAYKEDRAMVYGCYHSQQHALPKLRDLDLLILHLGKLPLAYAEEDMMVAPTRLYPLEAKQWRSSARAAMARETGWLLTFAKQAARVIVIPNSGDAQGLSPEHRAYLDLSCSRPKRGSNAVEQCVVPKIPERFLRSGNLALLVSSSSAAESAESMYVREHDYTPDTAQEAVARVRRHGEVPLLHGSQHLIYDSL
jgi:hypothetical protein